LLIEVLDHFAGRTVQVELKNGRLITGNLENGNSYGVYCIGLYCFNHNSVVKLRPLTED
jgi:hypothetical protein